MQSFYIYTSFGALAQSVEQRTENPCVPSSILGGATLIIKGLRQIGTPFLLSKIDYKLTTIGSETPLFERFTTKIYYNLVHRIELSRARLIPQSGVKLIPHFYR